jgi:hypothetical protein
MENQEAFTFSKEFLNKTRKIFEPYYKRSLSDEECTEIANNVINLELLLREIAEKNQNK